MSEKREETCGNCKFASIGDLFGIYTFCYRYPPAAMPPYLPQVKESHWCGEFQRRKLPAPTLEELQREYDKSQIAREPVKAHFPPDFKLDLKDPNFKLDLDDQARANIDARAATLKHSVEATRPNFAERAKKAIEQINDGIAKSFGVAAHQPSPILTIEPKPLGSKQENLYQIHAVAYDDGTLLLRQEGGRLYPQAPLPNTEMHMVMEEEAAEGCQIGSLIMVPHPIAGCQPMLMRVVARFPVRRKVRRAEHNAACKLEYACPVKPTKSAQDEIDEVELAHIKYLRASVTEAIRLLDKTPGPNYTLNRQVLTDLVIASECWIEELDREDDVEVEENVEEDVEEEEDRKAKDEIVRSMDMGEQGGAYIPE